MSVIEEIPSDEVKVASTSNSDTDGEMPPLEENGEEKNAENGGVEKEGGEGTTGGRTKQSKHEKKVRSILSRLDLQPVTGVASVRLRRNKQVPLVITNADVYKYPYSDTYIIFGDVKIEDLAAQSRSEAAGRFTQKLNAAMREGGIEGGEFLGAGGKGKVGGGISPPSHHIVGDQKVTYIEEDTAGEGEEEGGGGEELTNLQEKDVELIMSQTSCTKKQAVQALKKTDWDVVEAIMNLAA